MAETDLLATCHRRIAERYARLLGLRVFEPPFEPYVFTVSAVHRQNPDPGVRWLLQEVSEVADGSQTVNA